MKIHLAKRAKEGKNTSLTECGKSIYSHKNMPVITSDELFVNAEESKCCSRCLAKAKILGLRK